LIFWGWYLFRNQIFRLNLKAKSVYNSEEDLELTSAMEEEWLLLGFRSFLGRKLD
jgi:hypothetical protein